MITRSELLDVVYRFYPRGVLPYARIYVPPNEPSYDDTEEHLRLVEAANRGRAECPTWEAMTDRMGDRYGLQNESISLLAGWVLPAYSARMWLTDETALSFHVSLLGPYYGIHLPGIPEEEPVAREIAREIEAAYPGYKQIPPELGNELVPDVAMDGALMGKATIYVALFSRVWTLVEPEPSRLGKDSMKHTLGELLDVVYRFYPRGVQPYARIHAPANDPFYNDTEEHLRLVEAANRGRAEYPTWKAMIGRLGDRYGLQDESLSLLAGRTHPVYSARIRLTDQTALSFHVSLLGPYYGIHLPGAPPEEPLVREIAREIEATYPGYNQIPPELGNEAVPDVAVDGAFMGKATIYVCLFSNIWTWADPEPWRLGKGSIKHTQGELLDIIYRYYPRGVGIVDGDIDVQLIHASEEHAQLAAARQQVATDERWPALFRRIVERFPDASLMNHSLYLPTGGQDACHSFSLSQPGAADHRMLWFQVSFLAPYYMIHGSRIADIVKEPRKDSFRVIWFGLDFHVERSPFDPELIANVDDETRKLVTIKRRYITFDLLPDERPYVEWIAREIETTFACEPMPPEVGTVLVPDLATPKLPGEVRLYDCLFSADEWGRSSPADVPSSDASVNPIHLTEPFLATLTVLAALYRIFLFLNGHRKGYCVVSMDGILRREDGLGILAQIRRLIESPMAPCGIAAKRKIETAAREFEELLAAWDGNGAPSDAMVAWASSFLGSWDDGEDGRLRED